MSTSRPKVTVIGGGTGSFTILSALRDQGYDLTALVNMVDDGGSTGLLRDEYGVLPPGDIRQCLVALSKAPMPLRNLFNFRFPGDSELGGHSFGNLFLSAVEMVTDDFSEAVKLASSVLNIKGKVLPVTTKDCQLVMDTGDQKVVGQAAIEKTMLKEGLRPTISLQPKSAINPEAAAALEVADLIIIAPGSIYSSIISALIVDGMAKSLKKSKATLVFIANLINKPNHTLGFKVTDYISEIEKYIGQGSIDYVLYNVDEPTSQQLEKYADKQEYPVITDKQNLETGPYKAVAGNFLSHNNSQQDKDDIFTKRSLVRHDGRAVAAAIKGILSQSS